MNNGITPPEDKLEKRKRFLINFAYFAVLFILSVLFVRYALPYLWAFVIALLVVMLLRKPAKAMNKHWKIDYRAGSVFLVLLFYATIGVGVSFAVLALVKKVIDIAVSVPDFFTNTLTPAVSNAFSTIEENLAELSEKLNLDISLNLDETISSLISTVTEFVTKASTSVLSNTKNIAVSFSSGLINVFVCIIATAFGLMDYDNLVNWTKTQLGERRSKFASEVAGHLGNLIWKYILSYGLILLITFAELSLGLGIILRNERAFMYAAVIALFDILPIIGSGLFLLPWAVISLFSGDIAKGIGLLVLWFIISIVRNIIEPKIVGSTVGMHPLLTLFAMIAGTFIYGGIGLVLLPVTLAMIQVLNTAGIIHLYKVTTKPEEPERSKIGRILSKPIEFLSDTVGKFFNWIFRAIFKKKPKNIDKEIDILKHTGENKLNTEISDEYITGSPEAADCGPRTIKKDSKNKKTKK